jgi:hypothetical protein
LKHAWESWPILCDIEFCDPGGGNIPYPPTTISVPQKKVQHIEGLNAVPADHLGRQAGEVVAVYPSGLGRS